MDAVSSGTEKTILYVACAGSNEIVVLALGARDGTLDEVQRLNVPPGITPLAIGSDRRFLYAGLRSDPPAIRWFAIDDATGELRPAGSAPLADPPMYLATDASGRFLFSASYAAATFTVTAIGADGSVAGEALQHTTTPPRAHGIRADRENRFLFVTALGGDAILQLLFNAETGSATPNAVPFIATPPGYGPRHLVFHPTADLLYVNGELDGSVGAYALHPDTGRLQPLGREFILPAAENAIPWGAEVAVTPDGSFLYASERRTSVIASFDLRGEPGALVLRERTATEAQPRSFAIDPAGRWLAVAGEKSNHVSVYAIDSSSGALAPQHRYLIGDKPVWVTLVGF